MNDKIKAVFAGRVKELRSHLNLSQKDFASTLDIGASYLSEIESGKIKPGFDFFYKLTKIYRVNPFYLFHGEEPVLLASPDENEKEKGKEERYDELEPYFGDSFSMIRELLLYIEHSVMVRHSVLEHFASYLLEKKGLISEELKERGFRIEKLELKEIKSTDK